jgi:hypothetical protein
MLRGVALLDREPREGVSALVDGARPNARAPQDSRPAARPEVVEIDRRAVRRRKDQTAF